MACPPAPVIDRPTTPPARDLAVDTVVVGAGPVGAAVAWHLARRGVRVVLAERCSAAQVRDSAGPAWWCADADRAAAGLWRELEKETGATLLRAPELRVRADQAMAALTAAAVGRGVLLRAGDGVRAVEVDGAAVRVRTRTMAATARRVVLVGAGPLGLAPALPATEFADRFGPVVIAYGARSFAVPLLGLAIAELAG